MTTTSTNQFGINVGDGAATRAAFEHARVEKQRARQARWRANNPDKVADKRRKYRENNRDKTLAYSEKYRRARGVLPRKPRFADAEERKRHTQEYHRARNIKRKYGLTPEEVDAMLTAQGGVCAMNGCAADSRGWCVDHCHATGRIRGILCHPCNTALGFMDDSPEKLRAGADYLERSQ